MENVNACFEIASDSIKFVIGYALSGRPVVLYRQRVDLPNTVKDGAIVDPNGLVKALAALHTIRIEDHSVQINISSEISIVLPSLGLVVFNGVETTRVVGSEIAKIDLSNVISLVRKSPIKQGLEIVDIIPEEFIVNDSKRFADPPLGEKDASSLTVQAKIHALPNKVGYNYGRLINLAGFRIKKAAVSAYCLTELYKSMGGLPSSYVLVDMGARLTSVALVSNHMPVCSASFYNGGHDLTEAIMTAFDCDYESAEKLKVEYGYRESDHTFELPLPVFGKDPEASFHQSDLNEVIRQYFESYAGYLTNAVATVFAPTIKKVGPKANFDALPIVFSGGASGLNGIEGFMKEIFPARPAHFPLPETIGARDRGFGSLLGLLLASGKYIGSLEDNYRGVGSVNRVSKEKEKGKKGRSDDSDAL